MKWWTAAACALAATGLVAATAGPAAAQYPGTNGTLVYSTQVDQQTVAGITCFHYPSSLQVVQQDTSAVSPDGSTAVETVDVVVGSTAVRRLYEDNQRGGCAAPKLLVDDDSISDPVYSPDGKNIAVGIDGDVYVINATTGARLLDLTPNLPDTIEDQPAYSPDGRSIAYAASDGIRVRPAAGGASRLLLRSTSSLDSLDYSPDGTRLLFVPDSAGVIEYLTLATGKVTMTPIRANRAVWSPDGKDVFFSVDTDLDAGTVAECATATIGGRVLTRIDRDPIGYCSAYQWRKN